ncbi:hypothetical protein TPB0596_03150 [Tsukamurella pulmonis]|uniref:Uncharacterized protein n=1 Tax=Tsukamurella pulmonis TaxID=47312 RepID=A0A1H1HQE6_9ACTN|nr:hypothetical protein [Tsukamurella pulmonis]KXO94479.1 hypothetical protein AXK56_17680 [Tsukamurella pulmonis]KXP12296.1 hypothetical protein AXK57_18470 [Tsukamurella pulmonis]RDH09737.1 hypothetical protein DVB88_21170 [Tsukamurella pulmonis]SDR27622.1 hypothetical protein SAMN04489765_4467 [Tsukamurella pulmonis]SUP13633.1 Uncharacterised protein [Tsukamurella pulmonis]
MTSPTNIRVSDSSYDVTSVSFGKAAAVAEGLIAELTSNNVANLNVGNWVGIDQESYQRVHEVCLKANENLIMALQKTGVNVQTAAAIHKAGQVQAMNFYAI